VFQNSEIKDAIMNLLEKRDGLIIGICNGFQALIKLGLVPFGKIITPEKNAPTLAMNEIGRHISTIARVKVVSTLSPWFSGVSAGDIFSIPVSHGEGRFIANTETIKNLQKNGQIASQYVDLKGKPSMNIKYNPNGSYNAIEAITSPDGRVLGKMGHSERVGADILKNIEGNKNQKIFESGVKYFS
jgi:phosphoribosylformylglycinamidine synthase